MQTTFQFQDYDTSKPLHTQPSLDYLAPEYILNKSCTVQSDMYSMGMLIYAVYNQGRPLFENRNNLLSYRNNVEQVNIKLTLLCWLNEVDIITQSMCVE